MFTHLHCHTHFSFGFGASSPEALVEAAIARGFRTLACTDTNGVYGAVEFQQAAESAGIRPILGAHLRLDDQEAVALAVDEQGWGALCRAVTMIHWRDGGEAGKRGSEVSLAEIIAHDRAGVILLSRSISFLEQVRALSGPRDLYAELVPARAPRRPGHRPPARLARRGHQRRGLREPRRLGPPPAAGSHRPEHDAGCSRAAVPASPLPRFPAFHLAPPRRRSRLRLPRLPRGAHRRRGNRRAVPLADSAGPGGTAADDRPHRRLRAAPRAGLRRRRAAVRHGGAGDARPAGARAGHHRDEGIRRLLPGGARHRGARPDPLRPRLRRQLGGELLPRHHPRGAPRRRAPLRAVPEPGAHRPARHRPRFPLGRAGPRAGLRVPPLSLPARGDGGQPQLASGSAARSARWPRCTGRPAGKFARSPAASPGITRGSRSTVSSPRTPTSRASTCRRRGRALPARRKSRWSACRGTSQGSTPAAWSSCRRHFTDHVPPGARREGAGRRAGAHGARHPAREGRAPMPAPSRSISSATARWR